MKFNTIISAAFVSLALLAGCATTPMATADGFKEAEAAAKAAIKKAASVGGEWRDSGDFLKKAASAAKAGDYETAINLAIKAQREGEMGYAQAMAEKDAQPPSYLR
ncbi:MAG: SoxXA-binding protein [Gammaproteobacteria bacterium]|nr:SoxXA-binding protein [Gammaproteobacteria bacterium]